MHKNNLQHFQGGASAPLCPCLQAPMNKFSCTLCAYVCVFVRAHIQVRKIDFPEYKAFELLPLYICVGALSFAFVVVYRPDPVSAITNDFFVNFADVLERTSTFAGCVIVGDVNLHLDTVSAHTTRFVTLLNSFGLVDHVRKPTRGVHKLDVFTALHGMKTRSSDENSVCLSVFPSVRPSVKRVHCDKTEESYV